MQAINSASLPASKIQFAKVPAWVKAGCQSHGALALFVELATLADYQTWRIKKISLSRLASSVGRSVNTVLAYLKELKRLGAVAWKRGGFGRTNEYALRMKPPAPKQREIDFEAPADVGVSEPVAKSQSTEVQHPSPVGPLQNLPQKEEEDTHLPLEGCRKRDARRFVAAVKKGGTWLGLKVISRKRDIETIAHRMTEYAEPFGTWQEVYCWLYEHQGGLSPFQRGCLASPVQFANQLSAIASDMQGSAGYPEWRAKRVRA